MVDNFKEINNNFLRLYILYTVKYMPYWAVVSIFALIYLFISVQRFPFIKIDRPAGVFTGVTLLVLSKVITLEEGYGFIDWDVITFLLGMMIMIAYLQASGFFGAAASFVVRACRGPKSLLAGVIFSSALLSALFVNDTVCLLMTPIVAAAAAAVKINPVPYFAALALSSNIGSALTVTGNPQNMYIGIRTGMGFLQFAGITAVPVLFSLAAVYAVLRAVYRKETAAPFKAAAAPAGQAPIDLPLAVKSLAALLLTLVLFISGAGYPFAALAGATVIIITARIKPALAFKRMDWPILLFFAGLFVVMGAFEKTGCMAGLISSATELTEEGGLYSLGLFSAVTALISNAVSNVPAVILMTPAVEGSDKSAALLALISTFAGNLTLVGSVANLIVAERAEASGVSFSFAEHLKAGVPVTLISCAAAILWIFLLL